MLNFAKDLTIAADKGLTSSLVSGSKQDQKLGFHPKVFNRSADKDFNNGLYALLTKGEPKLMALMPSLS